jgi:alkylhydroperoxidase domain protein
VTVSSSTRDIISELSGIQPGSHLAELRAQRPEATRHAQGSYDALFDPSQAGDVTPLQRLTIALRVATLHGANEAAAHYRQRLAAVSADGQTEVASARLEAMLRHAELVATRPRQARTDDLQALADAGLSTTAIVTLSQIVAFVSFQVRVLAGLQLLGGNCHPELARNLIAPTPRRSGVDAMRSRVRRDDSVPRNDSDTAAAQILHPDKSLKRPTAFTVDQLAWAPWLEPLELADATPAQAAALEGSRGNSPYFRLLARDVTVLVERTATDRGIFYTPGGAPRADRELAAAATSRLNGCVYCASVHARLSAQLSKRSDDIDRLLRKGVARGTDLELDERWQGVVDLAVELASTPPKATPVQVERLREIGLSELEILDVIQAGAFFAWANRLMLTLGEPYYADDAGA